jgi:hypothetical protein
VVLLALVSYQPLARSFILGQNSPLVLLGLCGAFAATRRGKDAWAGTALLLVALKPQILPIVLLALLMQRRWRVLLVFVGLLALMCLALIPLLGIGWVSDYAKLLLGVANWGDTGAIDPAIMHNWRGFSTNLFGWCAPALVTPAYLLLLAVSVAVIIWSWIKHGHRSADALKSQVALPSGPPKAVDLLWALTGLLAVLASIHLNPHDLTLLIFPAWILAACVVWYGNDRGPWRLRLLAVMWTAYALMLLAFHLDIVTQYPGLAVVPNVLLMCAAAALILNRLSLDATRGDDQPENAITSA